MVTNEHKPLIIIIPDDEVMNNLQNGKYGEKICEEMRNKKIKVLSKDKANKDFGIICPKDRSYYIHNPYDDSYLEGESDEIEKEFIVSKRDVLRELLLILGTYSIKIEKITSPYSFMNCFTNMIFTNENNNQRKSPEIVKKFASDFNLYDEFQTWIESYKQNGRLSGQDYISISFLTELQQAYDFASTIALLGPFFGFPYNDHKNSISKVALQVSVYWDKESYVNSHYNLEVYE